MEGPVKVFFGNLKLEEGTVNLVDNDNGLDTFAKGLPEDGLGLHANTLNAVYDYKGTVCHTKGSGDF
jgi:hypothetical protein